MMKPTRRTAQSFSTKSYDKFMPDEASSAGNSSDRRSPLTLPLMRTVVSQPDDNGRPKRAVHPRKGREDREDRSD